MSDEGHPDSDPGKVIDLFGGVNESPVTVSGSFLSRCTHGRIDLNTEQRIGICKHCGMRIEVFDWLVEHAGRPWQRLWTERTEVKREVQALRSERGKLKNELRNLKARIRYWRSQQPPDEPVAEIAEPAHGNEDERAEDALTS